MAKHSKQRTALLTGALGGLGMAFARRLAEDGVGLVLTDVRPCDDVIRSSGLSGAVRYSAPCDLASEDGVEAFLADVRRHAQVDILINNAAHLAMAPFDAMTPADLERFLRVNVTAPFQLAKGLAGGMREGGWGRIVNIVSGSAWRPGPGFVGYVTSKMALVGQTRALAAELGPFGICVNALAPNLTRHAGTEGAFPQAVWDMTVGLQAIKRVATPDDLVGAVSFLVSDDAAFMTGQTISVDGGAVLL